MLKGEICEKALRILSKGVYSKSDFKFELRDVASHLDAAIGLAVRDCWQNNYRVGSKGHIDPGFLSTYESIAVATNTPRNLKYSTLPANVVGIYKDLGVYQIAPMQDMGSAFTPMMPGNQQLLKNLEGENLFGETGYWREGQTVFYKNLDISITAVLMLLVGSTSGLSMDDTVMIPMDYESLVCDYLLEKLAKGMGPVDETNDNNRTP